MQPVNQILERNISLFEQGEWLFVNPPDADFFSLCASSTVHVLHQTLDVFLKATGLQQAYSFDSQDIATKPENLRITEKTGQHTHEFAPFIVGGEFTDALIYMPKSKNQFAMLLQMALSHLADNGSLYIVGDNRSGIKSIAKKLRDYGVVQKIDSARHCTLMSLSVENKPALFNPEQYLSFSTYTLDNTKWQSASFPGIFSEDGLDDGTSLLLQNLPDTLSGKILDFACGAGVITSYLSKQHLQAEYVLSDVSAIALYCAAFSLDANNLNATLIAANGLKGIEQKFNTIITNPPFHTGTRTDYTIVSAFLADSVKIFTDDARLFLVANRFLPYTEQLKAKYSHVDVIAQDTKFSVYRSH